MNYGSLSCDYNGGTLPVQFKDVFLVPDDGVIIHWATASELNNDFFSIERSKDGINWDKIGTIEGTGTSNTINDYSFWDPRPYNGISYYRIKQVDIDGSFVYSETLTHKNHHVYSEVYISADSGQLIIENEDDFDVYMIHNLNGQLISKGHVDKGTNLISFYESQQGLLVVTLSGIINQSFKIFVH